MTQLYLNPFRPEKGELQPMRKLARNFRAEYRQYQNATELQADTARGRWVAIESAVPGLSMPYDEMNWPALFGDPWAQKEGIHFVTGSMNHGLPPDVLQMADFHVHVPQFDDVPFLAPASAVAIVLQDVFMRVANTQGVFG
jgi:hypothetical protein